MTSDRLQPADLTHWLYRSTARDGLLRDEVEQIVADARKRNRVRDLTGCLHYEDGLFFQWLEGPCEALNHVIKLIRKDDRHSGITDLSYGRLARRCYSDWTMRSTDRNAASLLDWVASSGVSTIDRGAYAGSVSAFLASIEKRPANY